MESANPKASIGTLKLDSFNPSIMEETVQGAAFDHIQLARGRFQARLLSARLGEERLDYGSYNLPLYARGPMPETHLTLGFIMNGSGTAYLNGGVIQRTAPVVFSEGAELDYLMAPGSEWLAFQIKRETLEQLGIDSLDRFNGTFDIGSEDEHQLLAYLRVLVSALEEITTDNPTVADHDGFCAKVFTGMLDAFSATLENIYSRSRFIPQRPSNRYQLVKRAVEYKRYAAYQSAEAQSQYN